MLEIVVVEEDIDANSGEDEYWGEVERVGNRWRYLHSIGIYDMGTGSPRRVREEAIVDVFDLCASGGIRGRVSAELMGRES